MHPGKGADRDPQGKCRDVFDIQKGDSLLVLGDINRGIGIVKTDKTAELANMLYAEMGKTVGTGGKNGTSAGGTPETGERNAMGAISGTGDGK